MQSLHARPWPALQHCRLTLGVNEVNDVVVVLEDVHLLNAGDSVHTQALQGVLEALVVSRGGLVHSLLLPAQWRVCQCWQCAQPPTQPTYLRMVPLPPVRTAPAIFISLSRSMF